MDKISRKPYLYPYKIKRNKTQRESTNLENIN